MMGKKLEVMVAATGSRLTIKTISGGRRPFDPVESDFLASEIGVYVRTEISIFPTWKQHLDTPAHFNSLVKKLHNRIQLDEDDDQVKRVLRSMFCENLRQQRHRLKLKYYNGTIVNNIATRSHVPHITDDQWGDLLKHWSDPKNVVSL